MLPSSASVIALVSKSLIISVTCCETQAVVKFHGVLAGHEKRIEDKAYKGFVHLFSLALPNINNFVSCHTSHD